jgi:phage-related protein
MRPALEKLAAATGSTKKGQEQLAKAVDIAAASHTDLATATAAIVKADQGRLGALNKLVPGIDAATIKSKDSTKALAEATKLTEGAASDAAQTYGGQMKVMSNQIGEAKEAIGAGFLPILQKLIPVLKTVTDFVTSNTTALTVLLGAVAAVSGIILAANIALKAYEAAMILVKVATTVWTGVQWLLNAALNANPIGIIVLAIVGAAGLVVAIKLAYDHCETFRSIVNKLWDAIRTGINLYLIPLKLEFEAVKAAFDLVKGAIESPIATKALGIVTDALKLMLEPLRTIARIFARIAAITFDALIGAIKTLIDWLGKIHIPKLPDWVPGIGGRSASLSVGASSRLGVSPVAASSGAMTINVFGAVDAEGTARQIRRLLDAHDRRAGRIA